jgi:hypothetical protein
MTVKMPDGPMKIEVHGDAMAIVINARDLDPQVACQWEIIY